MPVEELTMKIYGSETLPANIRWPILEYPDCGDIFAYGRNSSSGNLRGKGGDIRSSHKSSAKKARKRRVLKKAARRAGKAECKDMSQW